MGIENVQKAQYSTPELREYGSIAELTQAAGSGAGGKQGAGNDGLNASKN